MWERHLPPNHPTRNLNDGLVYRVATRGTEPKEGKRAVPIKITGAVEKKGTQGKARPGHLDGTTGTFENGLSVLPRLGSTLFDPASEPIWYAGS